MIKLFFLWCFFFGAVITFAQPHDAEVLYHKTAIEVDKGRLTKNISYQIRINNRAGERFSQVEIPFSKLNKVSNIEALIKDAGGRVVRKLKKADLTTRSAISDISLYEDDFVKTFTLKHNTYPYTIEYSYQIKQSEFLYLSYWIPVINWRVPTLAADLFVSVPQGYGLSFKNEGVDAFMVDTLANRLSYHWSASYTHLIKSEVQAPPISELLPSVKVVPLKFNFDRKGSMESWEDYGHWQFELLQGLNDLPVVEKEKIRKLVKGVDSVREQIEILYRYLQDETRYINITIETGGLKPYPASYVVHNKYGDCKALTNYFKSMLDFVQIPAYYTKVYAGNPKDAIEQEFPSQQFNHAILYVPLNDGDLWIDCTSKHPLDYVGTFIQGRSAFVVDDNKSRFLNIPALNPEDVLVSRNVSISYGRNEAHLSLQSTLKGESYERMRQLDKGHNEADKAFIVRNYLVPEGFHLVDYRFSESFRDSASMAMHLNVSSQNVYKHYGNDILVANIPFSLPDFEKPEYRNLPVQLDHPIYECDTLVYELPVGYALNSSAKEVSLNSKYGTYHLKVFEKDKSLVVVKKVLLNAGWYPRAEYSEFYDFFRQVLATERSPIISLQKQTLSL